ncbi:MAG: cyclic nucleotide-binding protein [Ferruginibacter sp.]|nr:cyclic nucleotide-binding protein [Ferruginibacter sp.]
MSEKLIEHFKKYVAIDTQHETEILNFFQPKTFSKKANLINENTYCKLNFFITEGCLRMFFVNQKGVEQTIQFAIENWWITDYFAFESQTKTEFTIQAVEATNVLAIDYQHQEELLGKFPQLERYFRLINQRAYAASLLRTKYLYDFSGEEIYQHFYENYPEFAKRIPQHLLASYLNMTPEYLSEIKKKLRS